METYALRKFRKLIVLISIAIIFFGGLSSKLVAAEEEIGGEKEIRIAIIPKFVNTTGSEEYKWLEEAIPAMLKTGFTRIKDPRVKLAPRQNDLGEIIEEQSLAQAIPDMMDPKTVAKIGKIAGANFVAIGSFTAKEGRIRVDIQLVEVETATSDKGERQVFKNEIELLEKIDSLARRLIQILPSVLEEGVGVNVAKNSSFEEGFAPWTKQTDWMGARGNVERSKDFSYSGKYSCRVENSNGEGGVIARQSIKVKPGERYKISARCKSDLDYGITVEALDEVHNWGLLGQIMIPGSPDWEKYFSNEFTIPEGTKIISLQCQVKYNKGVVFFDDVEMLLVSPESELLAGKIDSSSRWGSGWLDLDATTDFMGGDRLRLKIGGTANKILVRLLSEGMSPDSSVGIVGGAITVPEDRVVEVVLDTDRKGIIQISVHGGPSPWGRFPLGGDNGPATLESAELIRSDFN